MNTDGQINYPNHGASLPDTNISKLVDQLETQRERANKAEADLLEAKKDIKWLEESLRLSLTRMQEVVTYVAQFAKQTKDWK